MEWFWEKRTSVDFVFIDLLRFECSWNLISASSQWCGRPVYQTLNSQWSLARGAEYRSVLCKMCQIITKINECHVFIPSTTANTKISRTEGSALIRCEVVFWNQWKITLLVACFRIRIGLIRRVAGQQQNICNLNKFVGLHHHYYRLGILI